MRNYTGFWAMVSKNTNNTRNHSLTADVGSSILNTFGSVGDFFSSIGNSFGSFFSAAFTIFKIVFVVGILILIIFVCQKCGFCFVLKHCCSSMIKMGRSNRGQNRGEWEGHPLTQRSRNLSRSVNPIGDSNEGNNTNNLNPEQLEQESQPLMEGEEG